MNCKRDCCIFLFFLLLTVSCSYANNLDSGLDMAEVDYLPIGSENIKCASGGNVFTTSFYVSFNAKKMVIKEWVENSKSLKVNEPLVFSNKRHHLPIPNDFQALSHFEWVN